MKSIPKTSFSLLVTSAILADICQNSSKKLSKQCTVAIFNKITLNSTNFTENKSVNNLCQLLPKDSKQGFA